jgi:hypothetical protein
MVFNGASKLRATVGLGGNEHQAMFFGGCSNSSLFCVLHLHEPGQKGQKGEIYVSMLHTSNLEEEENSII